MHKRASNRYEVLYITELLRSKICIVQGNLNFDHVFWLAPCRVTVHSRIKFYIWSVHYTTSKSVVVHFTSYNSIWYQYYSLFISIRISSKSHLFQKITLSLWSAKCTLAHKKFMMSCDLSFFQNDSIRITFNAFNIVNKGQNISWVTANSWNLIKCFPRQFNYEDRSTFLW